MTGARTETSGIALAVVSGVANARVLDRVIGAQYQDVLSGKRDTTGAVHSNQSVPAR